MKRPIGLTLAAVALGLLSAFTLLGAALMTFGVAASRHLPASNPALAANSHPPPAGLIFAIMIGTLLLTAGVAVWEGFTVVGLLKLKSWARYSILILGGLLVFFGGISALASFAFAAGGSFLPPNSQVPAHTMQVMMTAIGLFYLCFAGLGTWWLVYFNLRSVKNYFLPAYAASALCPGEPGYLPPPPPGRFAHVPTPVAVFGWLYLIAAPFCAIFAFVSIPVLFFGVTFHGWGTHLLYLFFAVLSGLLGWGLLTLDNRARITSYVLIAVGMVNFLYLMTPWGSARYTAYNADLYERMYNHGLSMTAAPPPYASHSILFGLVFCALFYGAQIWVLQRYRSSFLSLLPPR